MRREIAHAIMRSFRRTATPLFWYYIVTIAVPCANGAAGNSAAFIEHTLFVLVLPPVLIAVAGGGRELVRAIWCGPQ
jgi:hypothetical protein